MVGKERPIHKLKPSNSVAIKVTTKSQQPSTSSSILTNVIIKHDQLMLSPSSSEGLASPTIPHTYSLCEPQAICNFDDSTEHTSSNDKLDR